MSTNALTEATPPASLADADRLADLERRFVFLTRLVYRLSSCVTIPYWAREEFQELLNSVVLGGDQRGGGG